MAMMATTSVMNMPINTNCTSPIATDATNPDDMPHLQRQQIAEQPSNSTSPERRRLVFFSLFVATMRIAIRLAMQAAARAAQIALRFLRAAKAATKKVVANAKKFYAKHRQKIQTIKNGMETAANVYEGYKVTRELVCDSANCYSGCVCSRRTPYAPPRCAMLTLTVFFLPSQ